VKTRRSQPHGRTRGAKGGQKILDRSREKQSKRGKKKGKLKEKKTKDELHGREADVDQAGGRGMRTAMSHGLREGMRTQEQLCTKAEAGN